MFQRELQVFARARGGFRRAAAAGACFFFFLFFADAERDERTTNLIFEPTPLLWGSLLSLSLWLSRVFLFKTDSFTLSLSLLDRHRSPYAETSKTGGVSDPGTPQQSVFTIHHRGEGRPKNPFDTKKKNRNLGGDFFLCLAPARRLFLYSTSSTALTTTTTTTLFFMFYTFTF